MLLHQVISGERLDVHVVLDDPAGNSYLQVSHTQLNMCSTIEWFDQFLFLWQAMYKNNAHWFFDVTLLLTCPDD